MKAVVDSNFLQTDELRAFLNRSRQNFAVFPDYAFIEAIKGDTLASVHKSLAVLSERPDQVIVLKTTWDVCGLHGGSKGLQRRLVDVPRTREFAIFCNALQSAREGHAGMQAELLRLGGQATSHLQAMRSDALAFAASGLDAATLFTRDEQHVLLNGSRVPDLLIRKFGQAAIWQSEVLFANHPAVRRLPSKEELANTYIFRSSVCHLLLVLKWAFSGGTSQNPDRLRNDMVDTHFAAYSTYFDSLLSRDRTALQIATLARAYVPRIAEALVEVRDDA